MEIMNKDELKKGVKELVIALLKCKPTKDKQIIDFNVDAFMGGFEDYYNQQSTTYTSNDKDYFYSEGYIYNGTDTICKMYGTKDEIEIIANIIIKALNTTK